MIEPAALEHVNLSVRDCDASARLLHDLFGWHIRWQGPAMANGRAVHVGSADSYIALYSPPPELMSPVPFAKGAPINHVGITVDDLSAAEARVIAAGFEPFNHGDYAPGRRFYFFDDNGIEFEVVSYAGEPASP